MYSIGVTKNKIARVVFLINVNLYILHYHKSEQSNATRYFQMTDIYSNCVAKMIILEQIVKFA